MLAGKPRAMDSVGLVSVNAPKPGVQVVPESSQVVNSLPARRLLTDYKVSSSIPANSIIFRAGLDDMKNEIILEEPRPDQTLPKCQQMRMRMKPYFLSTYSGVLSATTP